MGAMTPVPAKFLIENAEQFLGVPRHIAASALNEQPPLELVDAIARIQQFGGTPFNAGGGGLDPVALANALDMRGLAVVFAGSNSAAVNDRTRLIAAMEQAQSKSLPLYIAPGHHHISGGGVQWEAQLVKAFGPGGLAGILDFHGLGVGEAAFKVGPDSGGGPGVGPGDWPTGFVQDFSIWNEGAPDAVPFDRGPIGLQLSQTHPDVLRMEVRGFNAAFDLVGNCYGTRFASCWAKYGWNNYGLLLREGDQNGQDLTFDNCWFSGKKGGVVMCGWGAGYHFRGGQIGGGTTTTGMHDWRGSLLIGVGWNDAADDPTLSVGSVRNVTLVGVNFESPIGMWQVRTFEPQFQVIFDACHFMGSPVGPSDASAPHGVWKSDNFYDGSLSFRNCSVHRYYRGVADLAGDVPGGTHVMAWKGSLSAAPYEPLFIEEYPVYRDFSVHTLDLAATNALYAGRGGLAEAGIWHHGAGRNNQLQVGALRYRSDPTGSLEKSADFGKTWNTARNGQPTTAGTNQVNDLITWAQNHGKKFIELEERDYSNVATKVNVPAGFLIQGGSRDGTRILTIPAAGDGLLLGPYAKMRDLRLEVNPGARPARVLGGTPLDSAMGVRLQSKAEIAGCFLIGYHAAVLLDGDHQRMLDNETFDCAVALYRPGGGSRGNLFLQQNRFVGCWFAGFFIANGTEEDSMESYSNHWGWAPFGWYANGRYGTDANEFGFTNVYSVCDSFESCGNRQVELNNRKISGRFDMPRTGPLASDQTITSGTGATFRGLIPATHLDRAYVFESGNVASKTDTFSMLEFAGANNPPDTSNGPFITPGTTGIFRRNA